MSEASQAKPGANAYRVLARKYRPADFTTLIGQDPMVRTLTNAFATNRIAQAWMLTGVRGVGKTTTARILARALNYRTPDANQPSVSLDILGEHCQAIMDGRHVDVMEMDAASHTGIDDIREIIEQVRYAPVAARYKVYIIDEVHMLSTQAFNGLLKTLEEPPPHVKFIFATTEIRKVPVTILSRCQRFDLRRVESGALTAHLRRIAGLEEIAVEDEAFAMIARAAEGSVRDALSIFDQAIAHGAGSVSAAAVRAMLGLADRARVVDLFELVMKGDAAAALNEFRAQYDVGADPVAVLTDLAEFVHLVTRLRYVPTAADDVSLTEEERTRGLEFSRTLSIRVLSRAWQMLLKGIGEVQASQRPVAAGEMVLIRLAHAADLPTLDEALKVLDGGASPQALIGSHGTAAGGNSAVPMPTAAISGSVTQMRTPQGGATLKRIEAAPTQAFTPPAQPETAQAPNDLESAPPLETTARPVPAAADPLASDAPLPVPVRSLADIAALAETHRDVAFKIALKRFVRPVRIEPGRIEVNLAPDAPKSLLGDLTERLARWTGRRWIVSVSREEGGSTLAEAETAKRESAMLDARSDPSVAAILARFPGSRIIDVRIPDAATEGSLVASAMPADPLQLPLEEAGEDEDEDI